MSTAVVSPTIVRLGARSVFGRRRGVLLFVLPLVLRAWSHAPRLHAREPHKA